MQTISLDTDMEYLISRYGIPYLIYIHTYMRIFKYTYIYTYIHIHTYIQILVIYKDSFLSEYAHAIYQSSNL